MAGERSLPTIAADLTNLRQELRELHQRAKMAAQQGPKDAAEGRDVGIVIRGK